MPGYRLPYFLKTTTMPATTTSPMTPGNETSKGLIQAIGEFPGITNQALSERFDLDKSSVHWHIERFLKDNLVSFQQDGKYKRYFLNDEARLALLKLLPHTVQYPADSAGASAAQT